MRSNSLPGVGVKLLSGPRESQSCPPTDPRREAESLGEHEGRPVTSWGVRGAVRSQGRSRDQREWQDLGFYNTTPSVRAS